MDFREKVTLSKRNATSNFNYDIDEILIIELTYDGHFFINGEKYVKVQE